LSDKPEGLKHLPSFPQITEPDTSKGFIDDWKYTRLTALVTDGWLRLFTEIAYTYGWRRSELAGLRVRQADLVRRTLRLEVGETKNDEGREVVMTDPVYQLVKQAVIGKGPDDLLLTRENEWPFGDFRKSWRKLTAAAGLAGDDCARLPEKCRQQPGRRWRARTGLHDDHRPQDQSRVRRLLNR
jgi:integrase